jgi:hypothetical protein
MIEKGVSEMTSPYTIDEVLSKLPRLPIQPLPRPEYDKNSKGTTKVGCAVSAMKQHSTNEGWELYEGLEESGYTLTGYNMTTLGDKQPRVNLVDCNEIVEKLNPYTIVLQDAREWMGLTASRIKDMRMRFTNLSALARRPDIFKATILKDSHNNRDLNIQTALEAGIHAWIVYYNERIVKYLAPYVREQDLIRTYHTIDSKVLPRNWKHNLLMKDESIYDLISVGKDEVGGIYSSERTKGCLISGAISDAYPLRKRLYHHAWMLPETDVLRHPGYGSGVCHTPKYLDTLSKYKVSICTCSKYGYLLRKICESVACGCRVITDLPVDEVVPGEIDDSLIRRPPDATTTDIASIIGLAIKTYDEEKQLELALKCIKRFDYRVECSRLAKAIDNHRENYNS